MERRRQVRLEYPQAFMELAVALALRHGRRRTAKVLGLPLSTIYRWIDKHRRQPERLMRISRAGVDWLEGHVANCEAHGFDLRQRIRAFEPELAQPAPVQRGDSPRPPPNHRAAAAGRPMAHSSSVAPRQVLSPSIRARVQLARNEIDLHYHSPLSCESLAGIAGMSRFHFIRTFKSAFGTAPYHYLMQVRIRYARQLLSTTAQPLDTIAAAVGFDSQSSLCKAFRRVEGVSLSTCYRGVRLGSRLPRPHAPAPPLSKLR